MTGAQVVEGWARAVRGFGRDWPAAGAHAGAERVAQLVARDTGGDGRFTNMRGGAATVEVAARPSEAEIRAAGNPGLWAILEHGTKAHTIRPRRRSSATVLSTPYGPRPFVRVSGVRARRTWTKGVRAGLVEARRSAEQAWREVS